MEAAAQAQSTMSTLSTDIETIVVVEDQPLVRTVARRMLARRGYTVLEAAGGEEALAIIRQHQGTIHLLLTDVAMPSLNGPDLARQVLAQRPHIRVLYMSGYTAAAERIFLAHAAFLEKPFSEQGLLQKVREVLDTPTSNEGASA
jgi:CheY-like chemotaxis protein